jgi:Kef-type K+ transport system membrane component KefB
MPIQLNMLFVIILGGGWLFSRFFSMIKLPAVLGMVVFGIICSVTIKPYAHPAIWEISPFLKFQGFSSDRQECGLQLFLPD